MSLNDYTGQVLDDRYRILKLLGTGGMGAVYLGQHVVIGKMVAVKFLHAQFVGNQDLVKRFYREAQTAVAIRHKNIIDVMDVGVSPKNEPYLVMEYLEGESLASMLERTGPISLAASRTVKSLALNPFPSAITINCRLLPPFGVLRQPATLSNRSSSTCFPFLVLLYPGKTKTPFPLKRENIFVIRRF